MKNIEDIDMGFKIKEFVGNLIRICLVCGSGKISSNKYTILCNACGAQTFHEGVAQ